MAKRVFEIAKELSIKSKAIVEKCQAENIPGITNHMSSVSVGLQATIMQWFSESAQESTAVETAAKVDLEKVRAPKKATAKKAAAKKASAKQTSSDGDEGSDSSVAVAEPPESKTASPNSEAATTPPPANPTDAPAKGPEPAKEVAAPAAKAQDATQAAAASADQTAPAKPDSNTAAASSAPAPEAPAAKAPPKTPPKPGPAVRQAPVMNVPERPKDVKPVGPTIGDVQKQQVKLSGPKVVRVEAPDIIEQPRQRRQSGPPIPSSRGPRGGGGAGAPMGGPGGPGGPPTVGDPNDPRNRRNRRRGPETGPAGDRNKRGGAGAAPAKGGQGGGGAWRYQDLVEREERLSHSAGFLRQRRRDQMKGGGGAGRAQSAAEAGGTVKISAPFTIKDLSAATGVKAADIVKKLFMQGVMATINSPMEVEKAQEIMIDWEIELEVTEQATGTAAVLQEFDERETIDSRPRTPVVTILGHVDHGKTSLLDHIRKANVAKGEAGGITQATSAFLVGVDFGEADNQKNVCFLDTPGHEAFTEMRSRGAKMTDVIVLVIAADDGVMPQTIESISHAKAADVPIIVALNKIDLPGANEETNIQRIYGQLAEHGLNPTAWGGETEVLKVSAHTGQGVDALLETLALTAEILELTADFKGTASGTVIESQMQEGRGATANILVQQGELNVGDFIVAGRAFGRVRDMTDDRGNRVKVALPSTPIQISGIDMLPDPGDRFFIVKTLKKAEQAAEQRRDDERQAQLAQPKMTLDSMFATMKEQELKELRVVLKADVQGSIDAIKKSIEDISTNEIRIRVLHTAVGGVTESDVMLANASDAIVFGFNVIPSAKARRLAEDKGVELRAYRVIYDIVDDVRAAATGLLSPEVREEVLGHAEVRQVFKITKVGAIAGCYVTDGTIERNALIRVTRDDIVIEQDRVLEQLKRFKDDAKEVKSGQECGMKIVGYDDIKEGDILECFRKVEIARKL